MGFAWHVRHVIDVVYHWFLKRVLKQYPFTCKCFPDSKPGFNWPTDFIKEKDIPDCNFSLKSGEHNSLINDDNKEIWRKQLLKAANREFYKK